MNRHEIICKAESTSPRLMLSSFSRYAIASLSLINTLVGTAYISILMACVLMYSGAELEIFPGGAYKVTNVFTLDRLGTYWIFFPVILCLAAIIYCYYAYIKRGKLHFLAAPALLTAAVFVLFQFIPNYYSPGGFNVWELFFTNKLARLNLLPSIFYHRYLSFLKFMPLVRSLILSGVAALLKFLSFKEQRVI